MNWEIMLIWKLLVLALTVTAQLPENLCPQYSQCKCINNGIKLNIICSNLANLSVLSEILHDVFPDRLIDMVLLKPCSVATLSNEIFNDTNIGSIITYCPFSKIEDDSFTNIHGLANIQIWKSMFKTVPRACTNLPSLTSLHLNYGKLTEIKNKDLENLTSLVDLSIRHNEIGQLDKDVFKKSLKFVDLSSNLIPNVTQGTFDTLTSISLKNNSLTNIDGVFDNAFSLEHISLRNNDIQSMDHAFSTRLDNMHSLDLSENSHLFDIKPRAFINKLPKLRTFKMSFCKIIFLDPKLLSFSNLLEEVYFDNNQIREISKGFFYNLRYLRTVSMNYNYVETLSGIFLGNPRLEIVEFNSNNIKELDNVFQVVPSLLQIEVKDNELKKISANDFYYTPNLTSLDLHKNKITTIDTNSFIRLQKLELLDLGKNRLTSLNGSLRGLSSLQALDISFNSLTVLDGTQTKDLINVKNFDLRGNRLSSVDGAFKSMISLTALDLSGNNLTVLSRDSFAENSKLKQILLLGNYWSCDCRLLWIMEGIVNDTLDVGKFKCMNPLRYRRWDFNQLQPKDLINWPESCPTQCRCSCVPEGEAFHVKADCADQGLVQVPSILPDPLGELDLRDNLLVDVDGLDSYAKLKVLDLENNRIYDMGNLTLPPNLVELKLAGNNLTRFIVQQNGTENITKWSLSSNPWKCDCKAAPFRKWLLENGVKVLDLKEIRCNHENNDKSVKGKIIVNLKYDDLCPATLGIIITIVVVSLAALLFGTTSLLTYIRYRNYFKAWLYSRGITWVKAAESDDGRDFDAFVSHSEQDDVLYLDVIIRELEGKKPYYSLCLSNRNYVAGNDAIQVTLQALERSKRVIVLLSQNYISDPKCMDVFRMAFNMSLEEQTYRLIIVMIDEIQPSSELDETLKAALKSTRYLRWGQKMFWEMLRYAMPKNLSHVAPEREMEDEPISNEAPSEGSHESGDYDQPLLRC